MDDDRRLERRAAASTGGKVGVGYALPACCHPNPARLAHTASGLRAQDARQLPELAAQRKFRRGRFRLVRSLWHALLNVFVIYTLSAEQKHVLAEGEKEESSVILDTLGGTHLRFHCMYAHRSINSFRFRTYLSHVLGLQSRSSENLIFHNV